MNLCMLSFQKCVCACKAAKLREVEIKRTLHFQHQHDVTRQPQILSDMFGLCPLDLCIIYCWDIGLLKLFPPKSFPTAACVHSLFSSLRQWTMDTSEPPQAWTTKHDKNQEQDLWHQPFANQHVPTWTQLWQAWGSWQLLSSDMLTRTFHSHNHVLLEVFMALSNLLEQQPHAKWNELTTKSTGIL